MMTTCEFANLCDCSVDILRTYREMNLLIPFSYDPSNSEGLYYPFQKLDFEIINCLLASDFSASDILRFRKNNNDNKHMIKKIIEDELIKRTKTHSLTPDFLKTADMILHTDYEISVQELVATLRSE